MERLTSHNINVDPDTDRFLHAAIGGKEIDWKQSRDSTLNVLINGPTSNGFGKDIFRKMARDLYGRLKAYEDTGWTPEMLRKLGENAGHLWDFAQAAENMTVGRLKELAEADKDGRVVVLPPEERTLDFPAKYTEIRALYHFCVDLGIKCTIEHLYDGYAVRFPDGSDFAQHYGTYGGTEGCVEPAIGDSEFDYTAVGLNLAKELVKKHKGKLEDDHA
nr:MAG TPA: hypothetical protein [Caudoviricetes sp.]